MDLERGDLSRLEAAGWTRPEVFSAKGRDGTTAIWGMIIRPTTFDPSRKYPVVEYIYAGPHSFHTPKEFSVQSAMRNVAELGFIVVQLDGMGTTGRSKAVHDVAWKNLRDAGFPDRIRWHQAVADRYSWYDITRVGIYGGSAGGQNSMGALLFHPDFYDVAVSFAGCHDNRMDKIWWNEQWMGWPLDQSYIASSNMEKLEGRLLAHLRRAGHECRPGLIHAGRERADPGGQVLRHVHHPGRRPRRRTARPDRALRRPQAERLLREAPARRRAARPQRDEADAIGGN